MTGEELIEKYTKKISEKFYKLFLQQIKLLDEKKVDIKIAPLILVNVLSEINGIFISSISSSKIKKEEIENIMSKITEDVCNEVLEFNACYP